MLYYFRFFSILLITLLVILLTDEAYPDEGGGGRAGAFLRIGIGARPMGMGGSFTAIANDVYATYWNPAGLAQLQTQEIGTMYGLMSLDRKFGFLGFALPVSEFLAFGINGINLRVEEIEQRDSAGNLLGHFVDAEYAFSFSAGISIKKKFYIGGNFKFLYHELADNAAKGIGFDAGVLVIPIRHFSIGMMVQDIGSSIKWNTESDHEDKLPMVIRGGIAIRLMNDRLIFSTDLVNTGINESSSSTKFYEGIEFWPVGLFAVRSGYDSHEFTAGLSLNIYVIRMDYGLITDKIDGNFTHLLSLSFHSVK